MQLLVLLRDLLCQNSRTALETLLQVTTMRLHSRRPTPLGGNEAASPLRALTLAVGGCNTTRWLCVPASASFASTNTCQPSWTGDEAFLLLPIQGAPVLKTNRP